MTLLCFALSFTTCKVSSYEILIAVRQKDVSACVNYWQLNPFASHMMLNLNILTVRFICRRRNIEHSVFNCLYATMCTHNGRRGISAAEWQKALTTSHYDIQLDSFAS